MSLLNREKFFHVANMVLKDSGRSELAPDGPHNDIITVRDDDRVLQIFAGPGSVKTEMLVWRVLYDMCVHGTPSDAVMLTTFTRRAATELNVRVVERCDQLLHFAKTPSYSAADLQVHNLRIGTIHSLCDGLLAEFDTDHMAAGGTQFMDDPECVARMARVHRGELANFGKSKLLDRLLSCIPLVVLFRATCDTKWPWPSSQMERVAFLIGLLNQQVEICFPRCGEAGTANEIELRHGPTVERRLIDELRALGRHHDPLPTSDFARAFEEQLAECESSQAAQVAFHGVPPTGRFLEALAGEATGERQTAGPVFDFLRTRLACHSFDDAVWPQLCPEFLDHLGEYLFHTGSALVPSAAYPTFQALESGAGFCVSGCVNCAMNPEINLPGVLVARETVNKPLLDAFYQTVVCEAGTVPAAHAYPVAGPGRAGVWSEAEPLIVSDAPSDGFPAVEVQVDPETKIVVGTHPFRTDCQRVFRPDWSPAPHPGRARPWRTA